MTKVSFSGLGKVLLLTIVLFLISGFITRQKTDMPLYTNSSGGGVVFVTTSEGFPINYIANSTATDVYSIYWSKFLLDSIFWFIISTSIYFIYKWRIKK